MRLQSYAQGQWVTGTGRATELFHAVTGEEIGEATSEGLDFKGMLEYGRRAGPAAR
jgi:oxepin-CoA hydrolase/3-oxo-5,6-dehydrosuberyl-CoA semialdehyde dehydrogenase